MEEEEKAKDSWRCHTHTNETLCSRAASQLKTHPISIPSLARTAVLITLFPFLPSAPDIPAPTKLAELPLPPHSLLLIVGTKRSLLAVPASHTAPCRPCPGCSWRRLHQPPLPLRLPLPFLLLLHLLHFGLEAWKGELGGRLGSSDGRARRAGLEAWRAGLQYDPPPCRVTIPTQQAKQHLSCSC
jgi:hypothetical protein